MIAGLVLIILAAVLQGVFLLPAARARNWAWEHIWLAFSVFGMFFCNWTLTSLTLSKSALLFASVPRQELAILATFGMAWGVGAVLFGLGMDKLGLALGYPLIMGLNASVGTLVPLLWLYGDSIFAGRRLLIAGGTIIAIIGISVCSVAGSRREKFLCRVRNGSTRRFLSGLIVAIASGVLSCLPNIGLTYGIGTMREAEKLGTSTAFSGNAVWFIFFTFGGIVNIAYCFWMTIRHNNFRDLLDPDRAANWLWGLAMGATWISSFYCYAAGTAQFGSGGNTVGWPVLISFSIGVGVLGGLGKGEWKDAPPDAKWLLWGGLALIGLAVLVIPFGLSS
jgi:L-rhamnose-H+ transport protein